MGARLTDKGLRNLKVLDGRKSAYFGDGGGLYLRVFAGGSRQWVYRYSRDGKQIYYPLEFYPAMSLADARSKSAALTLMRKNGGDPVQEDARVQKEAEQAKQVALKEAEALANRMTIKKLFDQWLETELKHGRKDAGAEIARAFRKDVLPVLGMKAIEEVTRTDIGELIGQISARGARRLANRTRAELRQMFGYAIGAGLLEHDPTDRIKASGGKATERDRHLSEEELRVLSKRLMGYQGNRLRDAVPLTVVHAVWVMLATCCRVGELSKAQWSDVNLEEGVWTLPDTKNGKPHTIYLSSFAVKQFEALKRLADGHGSVLPSRKGSSKPHIDEKALAKAIADRQRGEGKGPTLRKRRVSDTEVLVLEGGRWTPHDLRRTGATLMGRLGVVPWVIERCLNHIEPNKIQRTYQHQTYAEEQRAAWQKLGAYLEEIGEAICNKIHK
jgi:integrase